MKGSRDRKTGDITIEVEPGEIIFEPFLLHDRKNNKYIAVDEVIGNGIMRLAYQKGAQVAPRMFKKAEINSTRVGFDVEKSVYVVLFSRDIPGYEEERIPCQ